MSEIDKIQQEEYLESLFIDPKSRFESKEEMREHLARQEDAFLQNVDEMDGLEGMVDFGSGLQELELFQTEG